jgi:hypothetical protein
MRRNLLTLLILSLSLLAGACSDQSAFGPSEPTQIRDQQQQQPSFSAGVGDDPTPRKSPGGSAGGWRK